MTLGAYGKSITVSLLIHLLAIVFIAQWGMARGRYDGNTHNAISVRLEAEPKADNKNSNEEVRKVEVKQLPVEREEKITVVTKELELPVTPALNAEQRIMVEVDERNEVAARATPTPKLPSYEFDNDGALSDDPMIKVGLDGERAWRPVLIDRIKDAIQGSVSYPRLARKRGLEGTVLAGFSIDETGFPQDIRVLKSSGHRILDREVKRVIQTASPYPPLEGAIEVPVRFRLKD
jgi:protein TonB